VPEGDSIYRVASLLRPRLEGAVLTDARIRGNALIPGLVGRAVLAVESRGKHLLIKPEQNAGLGDPAIGDPAIGDPALPAPAIRVHLGMRGRWRRFAPGSTWRRPRREASLILATADDVFACFRAKVEVLRGELGSSPARARSLISLGPDLLSEEPDLARIVARARIVPGRPLHEVLMDQRVAAGIGNVYKSEVLFLVGLDPMTPVEALEESQLRGLYEHAIRLMRANLGPGWRVTRGLEPGESAPRPGQARHYVYRRAGRPCFRCRTPIRFGREGGQARSTYWCPSCQPTCKADSSL
jgi:endonuclease VIII